MTQYVDGSVYYYAPNKGAPIAFAVLFALSGFVHFYQTIRYRSWFTTGFMPWAALLLTTGFILREYGAYHYDNVDILIANTVLILSGPPVYAMINYIILSRILYYVPYLSPLHPGRVLTTFLAFDAICEVLVVNGAQRMVNSDRSERERQIGEDLVKSALILQAVLFLSFVLLAGVFQVRSRKVGVLKPNIKKVLIIMYISCSIITARCIYRIVEFFQGYTGEIYTHEAYFYVFEASIMFINTAMLNVFHPGRSLPRSNKIFLAKDGQTEVMGPGWGDKRPLLVTFFDPFDIVGLVSGRDKKTRFWDMSPADLAAYMEQEKANKEKKSNKPRNVVMILLDPLHLWGSGGLIMKGFKKIGNKLEKKPVDEERASPAAQGNGGAKTESKTAEESI